MNHDRFKAYMAAGLGEGIVPDCGCPDLTASFDDPGPYSLPHTDTAPWYDVSRPESSHFAGMFIEEIGGMDDPYNSRAVNRAQIGGALGGLTLGPRVLPVRATLFALSQPGLDFGLQWTTAMLSGQMCGATTFCNLGDLEFFSACPDPAQGSQCAGIPVVDETTLDLARTMFSGGLVSGPSVVNKFTRGRQVVAYEVVFTLATESPYMAGTDELELNAASLTANGAVGAESWTCPGFEDPCAGLDPVTGPRTACVDSVEDTCDWDEGQQLGPPSWATQTWLATGEEVLEEGAPCSGMTLTRTGLAGIDGCTRPSVRCAFSSATGGFGPISVEFDVTEFQGNLLVALWNPATDTNIPVKSLQKPTGTGGRVFSEPTGDAVNALGSGHFKIEYNLPSSVDPGTLYLIFHAFGGSDGLGGGQDETVTNVYMNYFAVDSGGSTCCNLEPGDPIVASTYEVPCYTAPSSTHRQVASVANNSLTTERALRFQVINTDLSDPILNARIAVYDPTLIGQAASAVPTTGGVWPGGVEEWECNALIGDMFLPEIPAGTTVEIDGRRRQVLKYANGSPGAAVSGDRLVYGGADKPWTFQTIPPCATYAVVVFADGANTPGGTVTVAAADLHLVSGVAA